MKYDVESTASASSPAQPRVEFGLVLSGLKCYNGSMCKNKVGNKR